MRRMRPHVVVRGMNAADFLRGLNPELGEKPKLLDIHLLPPSEESVLYGDAGANGKGKLGSELGAWAHVSVSTVSCSFTLFCGVPSHCSALNG